MEKKLYKAKKMLGDRFHICVEHTPEKDNWYLFRKYIDTRVYYSNDNKEIMNSEKNTIDELYDFAKKHNKIDGNYKTRKFIFIMCVLNLILSIVNIFIKNKVITTIVLVNDFDFILIYFVLFHYWNKNWEVDMLELKEEHERLEKEIKDNIEDIDDKFDFIPIELIEKVQKGDHDAIDF